VVPLRILEELSPHARVATAVAPFAVTMLVRLIFGRSRATGILISVTTLWFAINVLLAPYSAGMRQDIMDLRYVFR
jgi:hypothetical protein